MELKSTITQIKNTGYSFYRTLDMVEERISEIEDRFIEQIHDEV